MSNKLTAIIFRGCPPQTLLWDLQTFVIGSCYAPAMRPLPNPEYATAAGHYSALTTGVNSVDDNISNVNSKLAINYALKRH